MSSYTKENRFRLEFTHYTELNESAITGQIPDISAPETPTTYQGLHIKLPGDNININQLDLSFKLDEDYTNWLTIYNWILNNYMYANNNVGDVRADSLEYFILDNHYNPIFSITYTDIFPVSITQIQHNAGTLDADELEFDVGFVVNDMQINTL